MKTMKNFMFAMLLAVLFAAPAFASGPWGANGKTNPLNPNGTYMGSITGKNITGSMRFASTTSGQITVTSTNYYTEIVYTGTGATSTRSTVLVPYVTSRSVTASGFADIFIQGSAGNACLDTAVDIYGRTVSCLITGGVTGSQTLTRPTDGANWTAANSMYFSGGFNGSLSKNWAANSFTGKGSLTVTQVDFAGFYAALANPATAATAVPQITPPTTISIKVSGVKTSDTATPYTPTDTYTYPTITQN